EQFEATKSALTRIFENVDSLQRAFWVDETGLHAMFPGAKVNIDAEDFTLASPHLFSEYIHQTIPLPNVADIRRVTGNRVIREALSIGAVDGAVRLAEFAMLQLWKPIQLLRGAYTVRVIAEEQLRMAASG